MNRFADYEEKKLRLQKEFQDQIANQGTFSLAKQTSNLFRNRKASPKKKIDVKSMNQVISIDPVAKIAEVEAMITYEDLVAETLKFHCLPPSFRVRIS